MDAYKNLIVERTRDFTGREWVFAEIDRWLSDPEGARFFILTGEPGIGKTAIAARLAQFSAGEAAPPAGLVLEQDFLAAVYFCIARHTGTINPINFTQSLSCQLAQIRNFARILLKEQGIHVEVQMNVGDNYGRVTGLQIENLATRSMSASAVFNSVLADPLRQLYTTDFDSQMVILIDAMDIAVQYRGLENIVDLLSKAHGLPGQVRFILTSRPENAVLRHFERASTFQFELNSAQKENTEDVHRYVRLRLENSDLLQERLASWGVKRKNLIRSLGEASQGNFLYLTHLLQDISRGTLQVDRLDALPMQLDGFYQEYLRTYAIGEDIQEWRKYRPLMGVLVAAQAPVTMKHLSEFSSMEMQMTFDFLVDSQQIVNKTEDGRYSLFHQSLKDFLSTQELAGEFWIDITPIHKQIIMSYHANYHTHWDDIDDYGIRFLLYHIVQYEMLTSAQETSAYCSRYDKYAVRWLFSHLKTAGQANAIGRIVSQVCDSGFHDLVVTTSRQG